MSDVGDWSRYSYAGNESTSDYHELLREFLQSLCTRRQGALYCEYARKYRGYQVDPPEIVYDGPASATEDEPAGLRFSVSKLSAVQVTVTRRDGASCSTVSPPSGAAAAPSPGRRAGPRPSRSAWPPRSCAPASASATGQRRDRGGERARVRARVRAAHGAAHDPLHRARAGSARRASPPPPRAAAPPPACAPSCCPPTRRTACPTRSRRRSAPSPPRSRQPVRPGGAGPGGDGAQLGRRCRAGSATCWRSAGSTASRPRS